ncbi:MAG: tetratricopeptide repeat protein [Hyphococcus sp.]
MIFTKRVVAPIAFAWTLAAAGMAAVALNAAPIDTRARASLEDIQVGERENQTRIALICDAPCYAEKLGACEFLLRGVDASITLDLTRRVRNISALTASPSDAGAVLSISTRGVIEYANTKSCTVGGRAAACIDLFFDPSSTVALAEPPPAATPAPPKPKPARSAAATVAAPPPVLKESKGLQKTARAPVTAERPPLREGASERMRVFARLTPPERLAPPANPILAKVQPVTPTVEVRKPAIRQPAAVVQPTPVVEPAPSFERRIAVILGKDLTDGYCAEADAQLQRDAWALGAMVDSGLCAAARGDTETADAMLARLLDYTPDNYEALVGRALIAVDAGEKGVARKYFQDALNALPPIEESNRIVEVMASL